MYNFAVVLLNESVVNMGIKLYNKMPDSIKNWITLNSHPPPI
jgi:hypothetical protein